MMNVVEIQQILPHRYPILLVDGVEEIIPMKTIRAWKNISGSDQFLQGHFPGNPIFPGVLITEAMAQSAALLGLKSIGVPSKELTYMLVGLDRMRFKRRVEVGDRLDMIVHYVSNKRNFWKFDCRAEVKGELACSGEILCAAVENKEI